MDTGRPNFEVLTVAEIRRRYRLEGVKAELNNFDDHDVPGSLRHLIPLARVWGIGDDVLRDDMVEAADRDALKELKRVVDEADSKMDEWLLSPAALAVISPACVAFMDLRMAADLAGILIKRSGDSG